MPTHDVNLQQFSKRHLILITDQSLTPSPTILVTPAYAAGVSEVTFFLNHARGNLKVAIPAFRAKSLELFSTSRFFSHPETLSAASRPTLGHLVSVEAATGITTGISAADRARTISLLANPNTTVKELVRPGHIFPYATHPLGVLGKSLLPESALDLSTAIGFPEGALYAETLREDGEFLDLEGVNAFAKAFDIPHIFLSALVAYRLTNESLIKERATANLPLSYGNFKIRSFSTEALGGDHIALYMGDLSDEGGPLLTRVQTEELVSDLLEASSLNSPIIERSLRKIAACGRGIFVYLRSGVNENRDRHFNMRCYGIGAQILRTFGVRRLNLLTNNLKHIPGLEAFGLEVKEQELIS
jgi:3,4-dihydroxy 2-butanone 4-phosphate synthase/GTP cyclohydrolase II